MSRLPELQTVGSASTNSDLTELSQNCGMMASLRMFGHSCSVNLDRAPQGNPPEDRLRGIFSDADTSARRKVH